LEALRGTKSNYGSAVVSENGTSYKLPTANDGICEIVIDYNLKGAQALDIVLSNDKGEKVEMRFDVRKKTFQMNRQESGLTKFSKHFPTATIAPTLNNGTSGSLRLFIDRCSIEAFDGEGHFAMTNLVFPTTPYTTLTVSAENGKARISDLDIYTINIAK
jgi:sucrose-6-phosphate hydrolase SacC (GH32 family)